MADVTIERQEKLFCYHKAILMRNICIINCISNIYNIQIDRHAKYVNN